MRENGYYKWIYDDSGNHMMIDHDGYVDIKSISDYYNIAIETWLSYPNGDNIKSKDELLREERLAKLNEIL